MDLEHHIKHRRALWILYVIAAFILGSLLLLLYWLLIGRFYIFTDDAYVHGNEVALKPQVTSGVYAIYADETDFVRAGQLIVELESIDFAVRVEEKKRQLADTVRAVAMIFQEVEAKRAQLNLRAAQLRQAELNLQHREPLVNTGAISIEEFETHQTDVSVAAANLIFAEKELEAIQSLIIDTTVENHPRVQQIAWELREAFLNLIRCRLLAPVSGYIAKRTVQVGDQVHSGQTLLFIVPLHELWLDANYKETQLKRVRIGQKARFTADIYGRHVLFYGTVIGLQPGSGNAFALLPPENAAGNWIKIVQRVPVRIGIDPEELVTHPLLLGLSTNVTIDVHHTDAEMLSSHIHLFPRYETEIYQQQKEQLANIETMIYEIIQNNKGPLNLAVQQIESRSHVTSTL